MFHCLHTHKRKEISRIKLSSHICMYAGIDASIVYVEYTQDGVFPPTFTWAHTYKDVHELLCTYVNSKHTGVPLLGDVGHQSNP